MLHDGISLNMKKEKVKICVNVIKAMREHIQIGRDSVEAGGILVGKENMSDENVVINNISTPQRGDQQEYNRFYRRDIGHIKFFEDLYEKSGRTLRYIGEWHTHPEAIPHYSRIDLVNWQKILRGNHSSDWNFHIIVGYEAIRVWYLQEKIELISTIFWKDVDFNWI